MASIAIKKFGKVMLHVRSFLRFARSIGRSRWLIVVDTSVSAHALTNGLLRGGDGGPLLADSVSPRSRQGADLQGMGADDQCQMPGAAANWYSRCEAVARPARLDLPLVPGLGDFRNVAGVAARPRTTHRHD